MSIRKTRSDSGKPRGPRTDARTGFLKWYAALPADERADIRESLEWLDELRAMLVPADTAAAVADPASNAALREPGE